MRTYSTVIHMDNGDVYDVVGLHVNQIKSNEFLRLGAEGVSRLGNEDRSDINFGFLDIEPVADFLIINTAKIVWAFTQEHEDASE